MGNSFFFRFWVVSCGFFEFLLLVLFWVYFSIFKFIREMSRIKGFFFNRVYFFFKLAGIVYRRIFFLFLGFRVYVRVLFVRLVLMIIDCKMVEGNKEGLREFSFTSLFLG